MSRWGYIIVTFSYYKIPFNSVFGVITYQVFIIDEVDEVWSAKVQYTLYVMWDGLKPVKYFSQHIFGNTKYYNVYILVSS